MLKFKPEDFWTKTMIQEYMGSDVSGKTVYCFQAAIDAQQIFDAWIKENGKVVYGWFDGDGACRFSELEIIGSDKGEATHKATLVNIEPIEKCTHPKEKISRYLPWTYNHTMPLYILYECKCGARVQPKGFEEIK